MPVILGGNSGAGGIPAADYWNGKPIFAGQIRYVPKYWDDMRTPATATNIGTANAPIFAKLLDNGAGSTGVYAWMFPQAVNRDLFFWAQFPHSWREGTLIEPHVHWCPTDANAGDVFWRAETTIAKIGDPFPQSVLDSVAAPAAGVAFEHQLSPLTPMTLSGDKISTMIGCRIIRGGANVLDTYGNDAALLEIDFHFQLDTPGSRQPEIK